MSRKDVIRLLRELPQSIAAEAAVLGSIIIEPACFAEVAELLCAEAFYYYENRAIYEALLRIFNRGDGESIDCMLLLQREDYYHKGQADYCNTNVADVIVAKQRNGPTGAD